MEPWHTGERRIKLADFGFATRLEPSERLTSACGSPHYCSPEVLNGGKKGGALGYRYPLPLASFFLLIGTLRALLLLLLLAFCLFLTPPLLPKKVGVRVMCAVYRVVDVCGFALACVAYTRIMTCHETSCVITCHETACG